MPKVDDIPDFLRPYLWLGVDFVDTVSTQARARCPWCDGDKWFCSSRDGQWDCKTCAVNGNALTFLRQFHELCFETKETLRHQALVEDRGLLYPSTLLEWGVVLSPLTDEWLVPGYGTGGKLDQLYRYARLGKRMALLPTPGVWDEGQAQALFGMTLWDESKPEVYLCEGPWDGMALYEVLKSAKRHPITDNLGVTGNVGTSLWAEVNVLAVPGCQVFREEWTALCAGKQVVFLYDNDHPREVKGGTTVEGAGLQGTRRAVQLLLGSEHPPESVRWLQWGEQGHNLDLPSGYDVRDLLTRMED